MKISYLFSLPLALAAPILSAKEGAQIIPNKFIVVMKRDASDSLLQTTLSSVTGILGAQPSATFNMGSFKGFAISASGGLVQTIANLGAVSLHCVRDETLYVD